MKTKVLKPVEIEINYMDVFFGGRFYPEDLEINGESFEDLNAPKAFVKPSAAYRFLSPVLRMYGVKRAYKSV